MTRSSNRDVVLDAFEAILNHRGVGEATLETIAAAGVVVTAMTATPSRVGIAGGAGTTNRTAR